MNRIRLVLAVTAVLLPSFAIAETFVLGTAEVVYDGNGFAPHAITHSDGDSLAASGGVELAHFGNGIYVGFSVERSGAVDTPLDLGTDLGTSRSLSVGYPAGSFTPFVSYILDRTTMKRPVQIVEKGNLPKPEDRLPRGHFEGVGAGSWFQVADTFRVGAEVRGAAGQRFGYGIGVLGGNRIAYSAWPNKNESRDTGLTIGLGARF